MLNTLVASGYSVRSPDSGLFRLAQHVAYLHHGYLSALSPPPGALPFIHALQLTTGETAILMQREGDDVVTTAVVAGTRPGANSSVYVGMAAPAHAVAAGRVLLSWLPAAQLDAHLARCAAVPDSPFPLNDPDGLRASLEQIRQAGYALDHGEGPPEVCCVAAPVGEITGTVDAAISLLVSCTRLRQEESSLIAATLATARAISALLTAFSPRDERTEASEPEPEAVTKAEIEAALATVVEVMSRVG